MVQAADWKWRKHHLGFCQDGYSQPLPPPRWGQWQGATCLGHRLFQEPWYQGFVCLWLQFPEAAVFRAVDNTIPNICLTEILITSSLTNQHFWVLLILPAYSFKMRTTLILKTHSVKHYKFNFQSRIWCWLCSISNASKRQNCIHGWKPVLMVLPKDLIQFLFS